MLQEKSINGIKCWTITSQDYVKAAVSNVEEALRGSGRRLPSSHVETPMNTTYSPEMNITEELNDKDITEGLNDKDITFSQELIGILR